MKDVSDKITTQRTAEATAEVTASKEAVKAAISGNTPKGAVWDIARAAAIVAAKKTFELIPYCHPIPIDHIKIDFETSDSSIKVFSTVKAIWKTGVEMEALTAASVAALTIYDMLKLIDDKISIGNISLVKKSGGKSDFTTDVQPSAAVLVTSDSVSKGLNDDKSGKIIVERLKNIGAEVKSYLVVPDDKTQINKTIRGWINEGIQLIITTGGTGVGPRDVTVDAVKEIIEREILGIADVIRNYGQKRTPYAMFSRGIAGINNKTLIVTLPGSSKGAKESLDAILPHLFHVFPMLDGERHK